MPKAEKSQKKTNTMHASVLFEDGRHENLAITWKVGSTSLRLCHKGAGSESATVMRTERIRGALPVTYEVAQLEAQKWFDSLDLWDEEEIELEGDEWRD